MTLAPKESSTAQGGYTFGGTIGSAAAASPTRVASLFASARTASGPFYRSLKITSAGSLVVFLPGVAVALATGTVLVRFPLAILN